MTRKITALAILVFSMCTLLFAAEEPGAPELFQNGADAQFQGSYFQAIEFYRQALDKNPSYADAMKGLAECYFYLDEYDAALEWIEQAARYTGEDPEIMNLEARVRIGTGNITAAAELFDAVLKIEPNNLSALFGRAELDVVTGRVDNAARKYEAALRISPENKKALLSLVLVYDSLGNTERAEYFARRSLELHSDSAPAHYVIARHFMRRGILDDAEYHVKTALNIDQENYRAMLLLSDIYLQTGRYREVLDLGKTLLEINRKDQITWYILGIAAWKLNSQEDARYYLNEAVHLQPDDELARIALEQLLIEQYPLDSEYRKNAAEYHFDLGKSLVDKNLVRTGLREFRRALMLNPYSEEGRLLYGRVFRDSGNIAKYVSVLQVLKNEGTDDRDILDDYEIYSSLLSGTVSDSWDFDQFSHVRDRYNLSVFYKKPGERSEHPAAEEILARYFRNILFAHESAAPLAEMGVDGFSDAFGEARAAGSDYFVIMTIREMERIISLNIELYTTDTGKLVLSTDLVRTGNGRIPDAFDEAARRVTNHLVPRGRLIKRSFNTALIDLGEVDGIAPGDTLHIIRRGRLEFATRGPGFDYKETDLLGTFTVTGVDYLVSEGTVSKKDFFDMINQYDHVIMPPAQEEEEEDSDTPMPVDLYRMLIDIP